MASKVDNFGNYTVDQIDPNNILLDPSVQRHQKACAPLRKIIQKEWNIALCEPITVNIRDNGSISCIDGQNRVLVARNLNVDALPARVFRGLTFEQENELFVKLNKNRKAVSHVDQFKNRINFKDPVACGIVKILEKYGIVIQTNNTKKKYSSSAVQTFDRLYKDDVLEYTLKVAEACWGGGEDFADRGILDAHMLQGLGMFLSGTYYTQGGMKVRPSTDTLIEAIKLDINCTPDRIRRAATANKPLGAGAGHWKAVADQFMIIYNKKHRGNNRLVAKVA